MGKNHTVILIPGLGDNIKEIRWATLFWTRYGLTPVVPFVGWRDGEKFAPKLKRLVRLVDDLAQNGDDISLVGTSAGGSAAINVFYARKNKIKKVVTVCSRLKKGNSSGRLSFESAVSTSSSFAESVILCERYISKLAKSDKQKIMTIRAWGFDELVPADTAVITGVRNSVVPVPEHLLAISASLTVFSRQLLNFLRS